MPHLPIRILHLEDNPGDARLVKVMLTDVVAESLSNIEYLITNATRLSDALDALAHETFEIVLADMSLPDSQGLDTSQRLRQAAPAMPLIVMSGTDDEAIAVESVQQGAQDYLVKGHIDGHHLARAIRYAIERKRMAEALRQSHTLNESLLQTIPLGMDIVAQDGTVLFMDAAMKKMVGEQAIGKVCWLVYRDDQTQCAACPLHRPIEIGMTQTIESVGVLGGKTFEISHTGMIYNDQKVLLEVFHDITDRKHTEEELVRRAAHQTALNAIIGQATQANLNLPQLLDVALTRTVQAFGLELGIACVLPTPLEQRIVIAHGLPHDVGLAIEPLAPCHNRNQDQVYAVSDWTNGPSPAAEVMRQYEIRASLSAPLMLQDRRVGSLNLFARQPREWSEDETKLAQAISRQLAGAVERAHLFEQTQRDLAQTRDLYELGIEILSTSDLQETTQRIVQRAARVMGAASALLNLIDDEGNVELHIGATAESVLTPGPLPRPNGITMNVFHTGQVQIATTDDSTNELIAPRLREMGIQALIGLPLKTEQRVIGTLIIRFKTPRIFSETEIVSLSIYANQAAVALNKVRLFQETRQRLAQMETLNRVSIVLRSAQTLNEMLPLLLDETLKILNTESGMIGIGEETPATVAVRGWFEKIKTWDVTPGAGIAGHVIQTGELYATREFSSDPMMIESRRSQIPPGWGGACLPIRTSDGVVGLMMIAVPLPRELTPTEIHLLTTLCEITGNAIQRMRLHAQTERQLSQVESLHAIDTAINNILDLRTTLEVILGHVSSQLRVDAAAILQFNPFAQTLSYAARRGFRHHALEQATPRLLFENLASQAILERRSISIPDLALHTASTRATWLANENFVSYHAVPLIAKGQIKGVLEVFQRARFQPDQPWLDLFQAMAGQTALAIDNAEMFNHLKRSNFELVSAYDATIEGWSRALDLRDKETEGHTLRVTEMTELLSRAMGISEADLVHIRRGALLHDIGKIAMSDNILLKPGALTEDEWKIMRQHPVYAYQLLAPIDYLRPALDIPYCHHEKWDGTGYPRGLKSEHIPLSARVFAIVDVWDALRSDRPYRAGWDEQRVRTFLRDQSDKHFDPKVVKTFLNVLETM